MGLSEFIRRALGALYKSPEPASDLADLRNSQAPSTQIGPEFDFSDCISRIPVEKVAKKVLFEKLQKLGFSVPDWKFRISIPVVSLEDFFNGNDDKYSIAANLDPHPGLNFFKKKLLKIRERKDVQDVLVDIYHVDESAEGEPEWPGLESVYIITSAPQEMLEKWNAELRADGPLQGWIDDIPPNGAPSVDADYRVWRIVWD